MTPRKENILILIGTVVLIALLTLWRMSFLTMKDETGPLPEGQRSMKAVNLHVEDSFNLPLKELMIPFELANGFQVIQSEIQTQSIPKIQLPKLNSSVILMLRADRRDLWTTFPQPWIETQLNADGLDQTVAIEPVYLIHYPASHADPNVMKVVNYLNGKTQRERLFGTGSE